MGADPEDLDEEIAEDNARADKLGLIFDSDPRKVQKASGGAGSREQRGNEPGQEQEEQEEERQTA
jgi:capsid protein